MISTIQSKMSISYQALPQYPRFWMSCQHAIDQYCYVRTTPPMNVHAEVADNSHPNPRHQTIEYSVPHNARMVVWQPVPQNELMVPTGVERVYYPQYNQLPQEHRGPPAFRPNVAPPAPQYMPNNVHVPVMYAPPKVPVASTNVFNPGMAPQAMPDFVMNSPQPSLPNLLMDPRSDAIWAPHPNEMYNFKEMRNALPSEPHAEQELEAGLKALERRIDDELFKNAD